MPTTFLKHYFQELSDIFGKVNVKEFEDFISALVEAYRKQANIFVCGNGGCASTASHFVCDINKGVSYGKKKKFKVICLNDNVPTILAYANDISYDDIFVEQLKNFILQDDLIIGISGSGNSKNVLKVIEYSNNNKIKTFGICGFGGGKLKDIAQKSIVIKSNDMQKVEDLHVIIFHCAMQYLYRLLMTDV